MRICWLNVSNGMDVNKRKNRHYRLRIFIYRFNIEANGEIKLFNLSTGQRSFVLKNRIHSGTTHYHVPRMRT